MTRSPAEIVADMKATGLSANQISLLLELVISMSTGQSGGSPVDRLDDAAERRRKYDREYKRKRRLAAAVLSTGQASGMSTGQVDTSTNLSSLTEVVVEQGLPRKEEQQPELVEGRKKVSRGTYIAENWQPSDADLKFATDQGLRLYEVEIEATKFRNYWINRTDARARMRDWSRAWQNWILNSRGGVNGKRTGTQNGAQRSGGADFFAGLAEVAADIDGHGAVAGDAAEKVPVGRVNIDG